MTNRFPAYRSSYNSRQGLHGQQDIDSSQHSTKSDGTGMMDVSMRSHHNFLQGRDTDMDLESDNWPAPMSLMDEAEEDQTRDRHSDDQSSGAWSYSCDSEDCYEDESCLCAGVSLLAGLLCRMYSETDDAKEVQMNRPVLPSGSKLHACSRLLSVQMANDLYDMIPETSRISQPTLLFATYRDGWSMESLLAKTLDKDSVIILIKAAKSQVVLGAYSTAKLSPPSTRVRGNGECFVFRLSSPAMAYRWIYVPSMKKVSGSPPALAATLIAYVYVYVVRRARTSSW
mmetsp:Transcript_22491/g.41891  ORF Transcript_22491/g.41891 Transcript_22491/m.41891 type:complete len:285 (-) Transcript_22491:1552-2406(-)